jgi:hypothetical protein
MVLLRSFATVGGYTAISRVLGFLRDILIADQLGTGPIADVFFVAFRLPNLFRRLFGEGAFNAAFVPLFARRLEQDGEAAAKAFGEQALAVLLTGLLGFTAAAMAAMPWLMYLLAPGFAADPEKFDLAVQLSRITFPYLLFLSLVALFSGILNALYRFAAAAAAPILLNIFAIAALVAVVPLTGRPGHVLAWTVAAAGAGQFLLLAIAAARAGMALRLPRPRITPAIRRLFRLMIPGVLSAGALQINIVVGTIIASLQAGAVSYLYYADRIYQLPLGMIGIAIGVVLLPDLSRKLRGGDQDAANTTMNRGLELALFLTVPAAVALIVIPLPIITLRAGRLRPDLQRGDCLGAGRLRAGPAGLRPGQDPAAGLFRARGHGDPLAFCRDLRRGQHRALPGTVLAPGPCGPGPGHRPGRLAERRAPGHHPKAPRILDHRPALAPAAAADRGGQPDHGRGPVGRLGGPGRMVPGRPFGPDRDPGAAGGRWSCGLWGARPGLPRGRGRGHQGPAVP